MIIIIITFLIESLACKLLCCGINQSQVLEFDETIDASCVELSESRGD